MKNYPKNAMPCWAISEEERIQAVRKKEPYGNYSTSNYFQLSNRIDNRYIQGYIGRTDRDLQFLDNVNEPLSYLTAYLKREKVYFTFDRITLYELTELYPSHPNPITFNLKRMDGKVSKSNQAFMIMPFHYDELDRFYFSSIKHFLKEKLNIDLYRGDDFRDNDIIIETIYRMIEESEFIIADTTVENKNAFYELGYASALDKEIITIQNKNIEQKLFFDRAHIRSIFYDLNALENFSFELESTIKSIRSRK